MNAQLQRIAAERAALQAQIGAGRGRIRGALAASGREAVVALAVAGAGRWLSRRFRWGAVAALALGFAATRFTSRR